MKLGGWLMISESTLARFPKKKMDDLARNLDILDFL